MPADQSAAERSNYKTVNRNEQRENDGDNTWDEGVSPFSYKHLSIRVAFGVCVDNRSVGGQATVLWT